MNGYHYMHIWLVEALSLILRKANFSLQQRNKFYFYANIEKVPPTPKNSQVISNPIISLNRVMRSTNNSLLDTQDVRNRGHG